MTEPTLRFKIPPRHIAAVQRALAVSGLPASSRRTTGSTTGRALPARRVQCQIRLDDSWVSVILHPGKARASGRRASAALLEFKLAKGRIAALFQFARQWADQFELLLDLQTWPPGAGLPGAGAGRDARWGLHPSMPAQQALQAQVAEILQQLLPHLAHLAGAPEAPALIANTESLHQFRVALRRLRSAAWLLGGHAPAWNPAWQVALRELFTASSMARDQEVLQSGLLPTLRALKAPLVELPAPARPASLAPLLQSPAVSALVLDLLAFALSDAPAKHAADAPGDTEHRSHDQPLLGLVVPTLKTMRRQLARDVSRFTELDDASLHRLRKRLKRLRYSLEFVAQLLPDRGTRRYLAALQRAQDSLGAWHDMTVAEGLYRQAASADPRAWFAVGWAAARKGMLRDEASRYLVRWVRLKRPW